MITVMEMTTGQWDIDCVAPDTRIAPVDSVARPDQYDVLPSLQTGLYEYVTVRPHHDGMPADVATQDLDDFLARMDGVAR